MVVLVVGVGVGVVGGDVGGPQQESLQLFRSSSVKT